MTDATADRPDPTPPRPASRARSSSWSASSLAVGLGVGLFTSVGTKKNAGAPQQGGPVPSFSAPRLNGVGHGRGPGRRWWRRHAGRAAVLRRLVPLVPRRAPAAGRGGAADKQRGRRVPGQGARHRRGQRGLAERRAELVVARAASGSRWPVIPHIAITSGDFYFDGDPYAVFVKGDGTISAIVPGPISRGQVHRRGEEAHSQRKLSAAASGCRHGPHGQHHPGQGRARRTRCPARHGGRPRAPRPGAVWPRRPPRSGSLEMGTTMPPRSSRTR